MRTFQGDALILDVFDLHEKDRIVTLLTRERGKKKGVARGARRKYSRFAGQLQPLAKVRVRWFEKEDRDLVRIGEVELERPADRLQQDLEGILLGSYLAEHLTEFVQEDEPGDLWFRLLDSTLEALLRGLDRDLAARYFEAWVLRLSGIFPAPRECPLCERPFLAETADEAERAETAGTAVLPAREDFLVCAECARGAGGAGPATGLTVEADVLRFLELIGRRRLVRLARTPPDRDTLRRAERLAAEVRRRFLGRELRSYGVIRSLSPTLTAPPDTPGDPP
ncbi:MAG: DNA repair protein RecO [Acidobacteriota bacterium]|jgi:DNA repair protein RecO (recombination protein O)